MSRIDEIREQLAIEISSSEEWINKLNDSNPGHYGVEEWEVQLSMDDIWVDIPKREFSFKNANFDFELVLGGSNDGFNSSFSRTATGSGKFDFGSSPDEVSIDELKVDFDMDLFKDE